jgi:hypothetical protein
VIAAIELLITLVIAAIELLITLVIGTIELLITLVIATFNWIKRTHYTLQRWVFNLAWWHGRS